MGELVEKSGSGGVPLSRRLVEQMIRDIAVCKSAIAPSEGGAAASQGSTLQARFPCKVTGATLLSTDHWEYDVKQVKGGGDTHNGLIAFGPAIKARNTEEELTRGGYFSTAVTALNPIATGRIVWCWWSIRKEGSAFKKVLLFSRDNEPICG